MVSDTLIFISLLRLTLFPLTVFDVDVCSRKESFPGVKDEAATSQRLVSGRPCVRQCWWPEYE